MFSHLKKPLVFFDLETTGVDPYNDRIVQLAAIKYTSDGRKTNHEWIINPGVPIPKAASDVHGITDEMVNGKPSLGDIAKELAELFDGADLGGYNVKNFDIPLLAVEFERIGLVLDVESIHVVDAMRIFQMKEPRTLAAAYAKYCNKELVDAHNAIADVEASVEVCEGQLALYEDLPKDVADLHMYCFPKDPDSFDAEGKLRFVDGQLTINFGKNKGKTLQYLSIHDPRYLEWIINSNFSQKVKTAIREVIS